MEPPDEFRCPILQTIMTDPVLGSDGYTYERTAIIEWLRNNQKSPMTRAPMTVAELRPNRALAEAIRRWTVSPSPSYSSASAPPPEPTIVYVTLPAEPTPVQPLIQRTQQQAAAHNMQQRKMLGVLALFVILVAYLIFFLKH